MPSWLDYLLGGQQAPVFPQGQPPQPLPMRPMAVPPQFAMPPEAVAQPTREVLGGMGSALQGIGQGALNLAAFPGRAFQAGMAGTPYTTEQMVPWAAEMATNMVGAGSPFAQAGALGTSGGGIKAYHGSPYDFERFDVSKIGTGEGAQAYGHGLYFAEQEATAKAYRDALAGYKGKAPDDIISLPPEMRKAVQFHAQGDKEPLEAAKRVQWMSPPFRDVDQAKIADMIERYRDSQRGKMYEVNIKAQPEQFLDWDKPLSQQSPAVQDALNKAGVKLKHTITDEMIGKARMEGRHGEADFLEGQRNYIDRNAEQTGQQALIKLASKENQGFREYDYPQATAALREAGIPGIRYLDQGSRGTGVANVTELNGKWFAPGSMTPHATKEAAQQAAEQNITRNYVVFNDQLIDILRKYGLIGMLGGSTAAPIFAGQQSMPAMPGVNMAPVPRGPLESPHYPPVAGLGIRG